jgi:RNA polymerase sigma-70 factor (ECF subfamily)
MSVVPSADTRLAALPGAIDATSQRWIEGLRASGTEHEICVAALHALLLRVARHEVSRRAGSLRVYGPELDDIAQQASDDAVMAVRSKAASFRGDSRFTTWAYKFVMFEVSTKMGRHFWRKERASLDEAAWDRLPDTLFVAPERSAEERELFALLRRAIDEDLTQLQRRVFVAIALNEVPMDALARELGSTRNAIYKVLFDARRRLRACLQSAGYDLSVSPMQAS